MLPDGEHTFLLIKTSLLLMMAHKLLRFVVCELVHEFLSWHFQLYFLLCLLLCLYQDPDAEASVFYLCVFTWIINE